MNNKPLWSALGAILYIVGIATLIEHLSVLFSGNDAMAPMVMLGLLVLSVAVMAYLFLHEPVRLYFENKKSEAISAFLKTILFFGGFVLLSIAILAATTR